MSETALINNVIPRADVVKCVARIGVEIRNIKLSGDLPDQMIAAINSLVLEHKVVFFRDQDHLDDAEQENFALRFGKLAAHPILGATKGTSSILDLDSARAGNRADVWHADGTFLSAYPKISLLRAVVIPPFGGDTIWSNTAAAYLDLPPPLQRLADELWAVHSNAIDHAVMPRASEADKKHFEEVYTTTIYETEHPVVRVHPETGERTLVLGDRVQRFVSIPKYDGQRLFDLFQSHITAPENTVRWNWKEGDLAMWDNRATQHYAVTDYGDQHRVVRRATIDGDVPMSVDGRCSVMRVKAKRPHANVA
ncbi:TauD/TfdA family dioxygenase [Bradyrhizobium sp. ISRA443]|uniref:TauD/TfdA dioxygenase family protein n=1 Tax=unclassified Bradyrhizobium TaxID=2631580 RepID=UPI00247A998B|nr:MULTISPECIES: TauD/TfdA family dioxygenase [unclassified Bradyrhizobium]WGR93396.1 TauD/TfdA family dioxygenase [Bradyrhizobium sp. ISRA435]WGR97936.1 TauD/TfdA family dioxygenase [Bradyrhizobium sp. ISRA436]WGS04826.1 TauD/TfdA family dioxygenase [Bradyrhizobium sp. ISRA437]WGS11707.1 TauD/TfdA family dioxygenase [Bradyrhizobium sp. ISRA443]